MPVKYSNHIIALGIIGFAYLCFTACHSSESSKSNSTAVNKPKPDRTIPANAWKAPSFATIPSGKAGDEIRYGRELIAHTALYFGPKGSVARISNGMNCQNCHPDAGTRYLGNNFGGFIASHPKMNYRAGRMIPASQRILECFERSLNGTSPDTNGKEVRAMLAYMQWVGRDVKKGSKVIGTSTERLAFLTRAADPAKGRAVYIAKCQVCHGNNGQGLPDAGKIAYQYPPLWGPNSYNDGAGMYYISNLAGFVKNNMPFGTTYTDPQLTDEQAWDVAAFVNSQPRPHRDQRNDWKNKAKKPVDFPFGPYADPFTEQQHKYGPFAPTKAAKDKANKS
jgi:thiosulfate dehydrogenase